MRIFISLFLFFSGTGTNLFSSQRKGSMLSKASQSQNIKQLENSYRRTKRTKRKRKRSGDNISIILGFFIPGGFPKAAD
jgi:hypothetical protein